MKLKIAALMTGGICLQALLLSSGCTNHNTLAPRGYIPAADLDPGANVVQQQPQQQQHGTPQRQQQEAPPMEVEETSIPPQTTYNPQPQETMQRQPERPIVTAPEKYVVKKNDTLSQIGQHYGVGAAALASYNNIDIKKPIRVGQVILIPPPGTFINVPRKTTTAASGKKAAKTSSKSASKSTVSTAGLTDGYYVVKKGDSVSRIAANFKVKRVDLMKANNINENTILQIGQKMVIPGKSPSNLQAVSTTRKTTSSGQRKVASQSQTAAKIAPTPTPTPVNPTPSTPASSATADDILGDLRDPVSAPVTSPPSNPTPVPPADPIATAPVTPPTPPSSLLPQKTSIEAPNDTTLENIAAAYGTTVDDLKKLNPDLKDIKIIQAGRVIFIPLAP